MREILFRGKRQDGVWFEGSLLRYKVETPSRTENHYKIQEFNYGYSDDELINQEYMSGFDEEVIPETVGQFTGLTDKNGKKIFEGDIVKWDEKEWGRPYNELVEFDYELLTMREHDYEQWCEVIGNIHDNPELLKEQQNER